MLKMRGISLLLATCVTSSLTLAPSLSFAAATCPQVSPEAMISLLIQVDQDKDKLQKAKDGLADLKKQLSSSGTHRILLYTGTVATPVAMFFTWVSALAASGAQGYSTPMHNWLFGIEAVAEGGLVYLDVRNYKSRSALEELIAQADAKISTAETNLADEKAEIEACHKALGQ